MASPSETVVFNQLVAAIKILEKMRRAAEVETDNWVGLEDTYVQLLNTDFAVEALEAIASARSRLDGLLREGLSVLAPPVRQLGRTNDFAETDTLSIIVRQFRRMVDTTSDRIASRQFTFGSPAAAGGNNGTGTLERLTTDSDGFDIENQHADTKIARCIADSNTGTDKHEEVFEVSGESPGRDSLQVSGSGAVTNIAVSSARDSLLGNPSFSRFSGTIAVPTAINDWTINDLAQVSLNESDYYRGFAGDTTPRALHMTADGVTQVTIEQKLSVRRIRLAADQPYFLRVAYKLNAGQVPAIASTMTILLGTISTVVALDSGLTGWQVAKVPSTNGANNWPRNFDIEDMAVKFTFAGTVSGDEVLIDDVLFLPWIAFDGAWYVFAGGATPHLIEDQFDWADTEIGSIVQVWLWRAMGLYLPHSTGGGITIADPVFS